MGNVWYCSNFSHSGQSETKNSPSLLLQVSINKKKHILFYWSRIVNVSCCFPYSQSSVSPSIQGPHVGYRSIVNLHTEFFSFAPCLCVYITHKNMIQSPFPLRSPMCLCMCTCYNCLILPPAVPQISVIHKPKSSPILKPIIVQAWSNCVCCPNSAGNDWALVLHPSLNYQSRGDARCRRALAQFRRQCSIICNISWRCSVEQFVFIAIRYYSLYDYLPSSCPLSLTYDRRFLFAHDFFCQLGLKRSGHLHAAK